MCEFLLLSRRLYETSRDSRSIKCRFSFGSQITRRERNIFQNMTFVADFMKIKWISIYPGSQDGEAIRAFLGFYPGKLTKRSKVEIRNAMIVFEKNDEDGEYTQRDGRSVKISDLFNALKTQKILSVTFKADDDSDCEIAVIQG